jgi:hypothetical protein
MIIDLKAFLTKVTTETPGWKDTPEGSLTEVIKAIKVFNALGSMGKPSPLLLQPLLESIAVKPVKTTQGNCMLYLCTVNHSKTSQRRRRSDAGLL